MASTGYLLMKVIFNHPIRLRRYENSSQSHIEKGKQIDTDDYKKPGNYQQLSCLQGDLRFLATILRYATDCWLKSWNGTTQKDETGNESCMLGENTDNHMGAQTDSHKTWPHVTVYNQQS